LGDYEMKISAKMEIAILHNMMNVRRKDFIRTKAKG
jgi:hypothetical protein